MAQMARRLKLRRRGFLRGGWDRPRVWSVSAPSFKQSFSLYLQQKLRTTLATPILTGEGPLAIVILKTRLVVQGRQAVTVHRVLRRGAVGDLAPVRRQASQVLVL